MTNQILETADTMSFIINPSRHLVNDGLLARWKFDGDLLDSVGGSDGTLVGSGSSISDAGLDTNGSTGGARFGDQTWFNGTDSKFSFSVRININSLASQNNLLMKATDSSCSQNQREFYSFVTTAGELRFAFHTALNGSAYGTAKASSLTLSTSTEYHIAISYDGSIATSNGANRVKFYINGTNYTSASHASSGTIGDIQNGTAQVSLGVAVKSTGSVCGSYTPDVLFEECRVYNKVLTPAEAIKITSGLG